MSKDQSNNKTQIQTVLELNTLLADYHLYYQKLRNFHWNVQGQNFFELHKLFEELYADAREKIDQIAERILTLKHHPVSRFSEYLELSSLEESNPLISDVEMVQEIIEAHELLLIRMRSIVKLADGANDEGTIDLLGAYIRYIEKKNWMLRAWNSSKQEVLDSGQPA